MENAAERFQSLSGKCFQSDSAEKAKWQESKRYEHGNNHWLLSYRSREQLVLERKYMYHQVGGLQGRAD